MLTLGLANDLFYSLVLLIVSWRLLQRIQVMVCGCTNAHGCFTSFDMKRRYLTPSWCVKSF